MSDITHTTALQHQMPKSSDFRSSFKYENVKVKHNGNEKYPMKLNGDQGLSISKKMTKIKHVHMIVMNNMKTVKILMLCWYYNTVINKHSLNPYFECDSMANKEKTKNKVKYEFNWHIYNFYRYHNNCCIINYSHKLILWQPSPKAIWYFL